MVNDALFQGGGVSWFYIHKLIKPRYAGLTIIKRLGVFALGEKLPADIFTAAFTARNVTWFIFAHFVPIFFNRLCRFRSR